MTSNISKQDNYIQTIQRCLSSTNTQHQPANFRACKFLDTTEIYTGDVAGGDFTASVPLCATLCLLPEDLSLTHWLMIQYTLNWSNNLMPCNCLLILSDFNVHTTHSYMSTHLYVHACLHESTWLPRRICSCFACISYNTSTPTPSVIVTVIDAMSRYWKSTTIKLTGSMVLVPAISWPIYSFYHLSFLAGSYVYPYTYIHIPFK